MVFEGEFERVLKGDWEGDLEGDFKQDMEVDLIPHPRDSSYFSVKLKRIKFGL